MFLIFYYAIFKVYFSDCLNSVTIMFVLLFLLYHINRYPLRALCLAIYNR